LHSAFYKFNENVPAYSETLLDKKLEEIEAVKTETREELDTLTDEIGNPDFSKISKGIINVKSKSKTESFKADKERFEQRLQSTNSQWQKYEELWNEKIKNWFNQLIASLEDENFFDWCESKAEKKKKIKEVEIKYRRQVQEDYTTNIWDASDEDFDKIKDTIFDLDAEKSPQRKTFYELIRKDQGNLQEATIRSNATEKIGESAEIDSKEAKKRIKFLAHDLPNSIREVKDPTVFQKLISNVDAPSEKDREEITNLIRAVDKLNWEDIEIKLIKIFDSLGKWAWNDEIKEKLEENELSLKNDKHIAKIKKVFDFYKDVMNPNNQLQDQHAIYVDILTRVEKEWWFDKTIAAYEKDVAAFKERRKVERKGKEFEKWKKLGEELKTFADALNIAVSTNDKKLSKKVKNTTNDYTRITRLSEKTDDYFSDTDIVDILADLNNDWEILPSDSWTLKTWTQFKELYNFVEGIVWDENIILSNLLDQAKLYNSLLDKWVQIPEEEFTVDQIKAWNKKLILMLQTIVSLPWQDLYTLMLYGPDAMARQEKEYEALKDMPESAEDPKVQAAATKLLEDKWITPNTHLDLDGVTYDGLHQAVAWALFVAYVNNVDNSISSLTPGQNHANEDIDFARGAGIWTRISFDEWVKWLSLNVGVQGTEKWAGIWLTLSYSPRIKVTEKTSITPGVHCWFIMLGIIPTFDVGASVAMDREWLSKTHVAKTFGWQIGVDYIVTADTLVFSAMVWGDSDRVKWIEKSQDTMKQAFYNEIMTPLLNNIAEKFGEDEFDLTKEENVSRVNEAVDATINQVLWDKKSEFKPDDIKKLKENTVRLLINYNNAPISNKNIREHIANEMAECYANAWKEQRFDAINNKAYLSGANAWVSFARVVWTVYFAPVLHLGLNFKKHRKDGYGDVSKREYEIEAISGSKRDQNMVDYMNKYLDKDAKISLSEDEKYVIFSPKVVGRYDILFDPEMKWLMKKDESWNILLSVETFIHLPSRTFGAATKHTYILIGWSDAGKAINDNKIDDSWFTDGEIDTWKLPGKETVFTEPILNQVLENLKNSPKLKNDDVIQNFEFDYDSILPQLKTWKPRYKITLEREGNAIKEPVTVEPVKEWDALQIEYIADETVELMDPKAQEIANTAYLEARKVESNALYSISHGKGKWESYVKFANAMRDKKYTEAKNIIIDMLPRMDRFINKYQKNKVNFSSMIEDLNKLENEVELWQALLSINNVFARVSSVQWWKEQDIYHFRKYEGGKVVDRPMGEIIERRAGEIERKINKSSLNQDVKDSYTSLIGAMENYRKNNPEYYNATSKERTTLQNAVWINLGNAINIENPLFNPEIYKDSQISLKDLPDFKWKDTLQQHAMEVMAKDKSLMWPILEKLNISLDWGNTIKYEFVSYDPEAWELTINIQGKRVKFRADMSVWYFSQCVNHMILLDNIEAEVEWEWDSVHFWPWVMSGWKVIEWTKWSNMATGKFTVQVSVWLWGFGEKPEEPEPEPIDNPWSHPIDVTPWSHPIWKLNNQLIDWWPIGGDNGLD